MEKNKIEVSFKGRRQIMEGISQAIGGLIKFMKALIVLVFILIGIIIWLIYGK